VKLWFGGLPGLALAGWMLAALPGVAQAQMDSREAIQLQNQLLELRRDVQGLREQLRNSGSSSGSSSGGGSIFSGRPSGGGTSGGGEITAALLDRVVALEEQVRRMQGRLDESENARQRQGELQCVWHHLRCGSNGQPGRWCAPNSRGRH